MMRCYDHSHRQDPYLMGATLTTCPIPLTWCCQMRASAVASHSPRMILPKTLMLCPSLCTLCMQQSRMHCTNPVACYPWWCTGARGRDPGSSIGRLVKTTICQTCFWFFSFSAVKLFLPLALALSFSVCVHLSLFLCRFLLLSLSLSLSVCLSFWVSPSLYLSEHPPPPHPNFLWYTGARGTHSWFQ